MAYPYLPDWTTEHGLLAQEYYVACRSSGLGSRPLAREILGLPVVLYRHEAKPLAFVDRCPHRNVPLSLGCTAPDGSIRCAYHGWRFGSSGDLVSIPGRTLPLDRSHSLTALPVWEEAGLVWVCPTPRASPRYRPFDAPHRDSPGYTTVVREVVAPGGLYDVAENALDVPHTAILHRGLFRADARRTRITGRVRRYRHWVETQYVGEPPPRGLAARLLALRGETKLEVEHHDRFFLPCVLQVEYRLGGGTHFVITAFLTPETPDRTRLYAVASFDTPLPGRLLAWLLEPLGRAIFAQDQRMLRAQSRVLQRFGGPAYVSTELDTMGPQIRRLLRNAQKEEQRTGDPLGAGLEGPASQVEAIRLPRDDSQAPIFSLDVDLDA